MTNNPHDKLFRGIFSEPDNAALYLRDRLPQALVARLDFSRTERVPGTWVDEAMRDHQSDLLFSIPFASEADDAEPGPRDARQERDRATPGDSAVLGDGAAAGGGAAPGVGAAPGDDAAAGVDAAPGVGAAPGVDETREIGETAEEDTTPLLLYVLLEHQSTVSPQMAFRLLRYLVRILDQWSREHPGCALPPVVPLVLYHGEADWTAPVVLEALFDLRALDGPAREAVTAYLPGLRYRLECLPEDPRAIRGPPGIVRLTLRVLKAGRRREVSSLLLTWEEDLLAEGHKGQRGLHHIGLVVTYLLVVNEAVTPEDLAEALKPMGSEAQEIPKTYGLRLIQQGFERGRQEGRQDAVREVARKLIALGRPLPEVAEATGLSLDELRTLSH